MNVCFNSDLRVICHYSKRWDWPEISQVLNRVKLLGNLEAIFVSNKDLKWACWLNRLRISGVLKVNNSFKFWSVCVVDTSISDSVKIWTNYRTCKLSFRTKNRKPIYLTQSWSYVDLWRKNYVNNTSSIQWNRYGEWKSHKSRFLNDLIRTCNSSWKNSGRQSNFKIHKSSIYHPPIRSINCDLNSWLRVRWNRVSNPINTERKSSVGA